MADRVITAVELIGDDSSTSQKAMKHVGKGILKSLISYAKSGNHVLVHYSDGSTSQHMLAEPDDDKKKNSRAATFRVELPEGVVP